MAKADLAAIEARRALVARRVLDHKSTRQIAEELAKLPEGSRPEDCSASTVARDVRALRAEWAQSRAELVDAYVAEELTRLAELEAVWRAMAFAPGVSLNRLDVATANLLAIHRERVKLLAPAAAPRSAGGLVIPTPAPGSGGAMRVVVEYVDDWRDAGRVASGHELASADRAPALVDAGDVVTVEEDDGDDG